MCSNSAEHLCISCAYQLRSSSLACPSGLLSGFCVWTTDSEIIPGGNLVRQEKLLFGSPLHMVLRFTCAIGFEGRRWDVLAFHIFTSHPFSISCRMYISDCNGASCKGYRLIPCIASKSGIALLYWFKEEHLTQDGTALNITHKSQLVSSSLRYWG